MNAIDSFGRIFNAWEAAVGEAAGNAARDPRVLALGAALMRAQLLAARSAMLAWEAAWAPIAALAGQDGKTE